MPEILYSKFSKDRQKKFQIATMIVEENGEKSVIKKRCIKRRSPCKKDGRIPRTAFGIICKFRCGNVSMQRGNGQVRFLFVEGESLEERIHRHSEANDYEALKEDYRFLAKIIFP